MWRALTAWFDKIQIADPTERRQAGMLQSMAIFLGAGAAVSLPTVVTLPYAPALMTLLVLMVFAGVSCHIGAIALLRRGSLRPAVVLVITGVLLLNVVFSVPLGVIRNPSVALSFAVPIALGALMLPRRGLVALIALQVALVAALGAFEASGSQFIGFVLPDSPPAVVAISIIGVLVLVGFILDRFGTALRLALADTREREQELERLRAGLEEAVQRRTAELQTTVDQLQASQATIRELGAPVLPVLPGVLVAPLIGALDTARAADLSAAVLEAIDRTRARHLILDITGVPVVDTHVARALLRVAQAARLLGAEVMLVGVRAEVAQTMVTLGVSLGEIQVYPNLQEAIAAHIAAS